MKTLTIKQPWASLIVEGLKDIENRTWATKFRGRVLVHAAAKCDKRHWSAGMYRDRSPGCSNINHSWPAFKF
jgi:hypothetical protein